VRIAAASACGRERTRRASRYAGTAVSEMTTELIAFAAAYACGTFEKVAHAGLISAG
jgi:hypothetical protein